jgi:UDP-glucuronate 4-epimerase
MKTLPILVTGAAGFIGSSLCKRLVKNYSVVGIDNFYPNYPLQFKRHTIAQLNKNRHFHFYPCDIRNTSLVRQLIVKHQIKAIFHLAALTGVRNSLKHPRLYSEINTLATRSLYRVAVDAGSKRFIFCSSSSVYGNTKHMPLKETERLKPRSPYAVSKRDAEAALKQLYTQLKLPLTVLRLFSVYGPNGRPDMAPYIFTKAAFGNTPIVRYGDGSSSRDYTYIDDVVEALIKTLELTSPRQVINIGNSSPISLSDLIMKIERFTRKKILISEKPVNQAESKITYADITLAKNLLGWLPHTDFDAGLTNFVHWFKKNRLSDK